MRDGIALAEALCGFKLSDPFFAFLLRWMVAKSESPVKKGGKHPIIHRVLSILLVVQDFATIHSSYTLNSAIVV